MHEKTSKSQKPRAFRRKLLAVSTAAIGAVPMLCSALGLGDIQYKSYLGEPLRAEIDLVNLPVDIERENLKIRQVGRSEAEQMGVEIISNWHRLEFDVDPSKSNYQVRLNSQRPIKEPYINILVELAWPKGTLYREYTIFLDPAPDVPQTASRLETAPVKAVQSTATAVNSEVGGDVYRVASGDTLSGIARALSMGSGANVNNTVTWLFNNNPQAFIDGDINRLIAGRELSLPAGNSLPIASSLAKATPPKVLPEGRVVLEQALNVEGSNQLEMLASSAGGSMQEQLSSSRAILDYLVKENRDLKDRLSYLEGSEYLNTLKELVDLQKNEIADLRAELAVNEAPKIKEPLSVRAVAPVEAAVAVQGKPVPSHASVVTVHNPFEINLGARENFWSLLSSGLAMAMAALLALFIWRTKRKPQASITSSPPSASLADDTSLVEKQLPSFAVNEGKKEISIDDYLDVNLAIAQKDALNKVEGLASNDYSINEPQENIPTPIQEPAPSLREVTEKVQHERKKVENLQQRIKEKTAQYNQRKSDGYEEPRQVEEIEIDSDLEKFLKF